MRQAGISLTITHFQAKKISAAQFANSQNCHPAQKSPVPSSRVTLVSIMESGRDRLAELISSLEGNGGNDISRATSPGGEPREGNGTPDLELAKKPRHRPRTYPYFRYLPYEVEDDAQRQQNFDEILKHLYIAIEAGDFAPGVVHWTRELRSWLGLKFDPTRIQRVKLVRLYYELSLAPGIDPSVAERFSSMFMVLTK